MRRIKLVYAESREEAKQLARWAAALVSIAPRRFMAFESASDYRAWCINRGGWQPAQFCEVASGAPGSSATYSGQDVTNPSASIFRRRSSFARRSRAPTSRKNFSRLRGTRQQNTTCQLRVSVEIRVEAFEKKPPDWTDNTRSGEPSAEV